ncbi:MAG TPA: DUF4386 domain-containing protein [Bauldia sp.]|nr:DUF4386 domain-containing protein [Bauldia sp.]
MTDTSYNPSTVRWLGVGFIAFAIAFNLPFTYLGSNFNYPAILREPVSTILPAFAAGGTGLILAWFGFMVAGLVLAPVAVGIAKATARSGNAAHAVAGLGVAAALAQAIGLSRWVYAVPGLAAQWSAATDPVTKAAIEQTFTTLHQFAGVGVGEAIGQSLTAFWVIGVALAQWRHPRFGAAVAILGIVTGIVLVVGLSEGLATAIPFSPGILGMAALIGFILLSLWLIWTGILCLLRPTA